MNTWLGAVGHFHPLLVHLPLGILLFALMLEGLARRERFGALAPAALPVWVIGALAAVLSCLTGWMQADNGDYAADLLDRHRWAGVAVAVLALATCALKARRYFRGVMIASVVLLPAVLLSGHWGITLTHGADYLQAAAPVPEEAALPPSADIPDADVPEPPADAIETLRSNGVAISPVGQGQHFLSLNFVNAAAATPETGAALRALHAHVAWLKMPGMSLNDTVLQWIAGFENLTRLSLEHSNATDASLGHLTGLQKLVYLNLVGTKVSAGGARSLASLPALRQLYLYGTAVTAADSAALAATLPNVRFELGDYRLPVLPSDTVLLKQN